MSFSKIDKRIKNARLAIERATTPTTRSRAEKDLARAQADKEQMKVTRR